LFLLFVCNLRKTYISSDLIVVYMVIPDHSVQKCPCFILSAGSRFNQNLTLNFVIDMHR
jgi:hypothetical protein